VDRVALCCGVAGQIDLVLEDIQLAHGTAPFCSRFFSYRPMGGASRGTGSRGGKGAETGVADVRRLF
jgi:hypothetical protein